ncbi:MAG: DUF3857 domain-containing protein [Saprospiraceae bacterium]
MRLLIVYLLVAAAVKAETPKPNLTLEKVVQTIEIRDADEVWIHHRSAAIVWNARGGDLSELVLYENKFTKVDNIEGRMTDFDGKTLRELKSKDIIDIAAYDGFSLFSDGRIKSHRFSSGVYPYRVEYAYTQKVKTNMYGMDFIPQRSPEIQVDSFIGKILYEDNQEPNYKLAGTKGNIRKSKENNKNILTYNVEDIKALEREPFSPPFKFVREGLYVFCNKCSFAGIEAQASSWSGFGEFIATLNDGRDQLPIDFVHKIDSMTTGLDTREKIRVLYRYLQQNHRYISVQVGIGGMQPISASAVYTNGYGDCKGLSNLMKAMLAAAGIPSKYALIEGGEDPEFVDESFVYDPFNHAVLCIPGDRDTTWLECTSRFNPPGYQGSFTGNRKALLIDHGASQLVSTNKYDESTNVSTSKIQASISGGTDLNLVVHLVLKNQAQDELRYWYHEADHSMLDKYWQQALSMPSYVVNNYTVNENRDEPTIDVDLNITLGKAISASGNRMFVLSAFTNAVDKKLQRDTGRVNTIYLRHGFTEIDTFEMAVPQGYRLESGPRNVLMENTFGSYQLDMVQTPDSLKLIRKRIQKAGNYEKSLYDLFVKFHNDMYQADRSKLVWVKL